MHTCKNYFNDWNVLFKLELYFCQIDKMFDWREPDELFPKKVFPTKSRLAWRFRENTLWPGCLSSLRNIFFDDFLISMQFLVWIVISKLKKSACNCPINCYLQDTIGIFGCILHLNFRKILSSKLARKRRNNPAGLGKVSTILQHV